MSEIQEYKRKFVKRFFTQIGREKGRLKRYPRFKEGYVELFGKKFLFHDSICFVDSYNEIFEREIYRFHPDDTKRTILDCGANIGLSVLFFAINYPNHKIIAFEPDEAIFKVLA